MPKHFLLPLLLLIFIGCKKGGEELLSSEKNIGSVSFKMTDNPGLSADVNGTVTTDSIKFILPGNISLSSLVPTIDFKGKKMEPANRTAQNFTNGLKYTITADDGTTKQYFFKITQTLADTATLILGNWKVIKDSVKNNNWINPAGGNLNSGVYIGTPVDFWKFEANGVFSARENGITGSDTYAILQNQKLKINVWSNQYGLGTIEVLTTTEFQVYFYATSSNGGHYFRRVYLKR